MSLSAPCTTRSRIAGIESTRTLPPSFGISCLRAGSGTYVRRLSSSAVYKRQASTPCVSMAAKVTPSTPGAPSFFSASAYAARSVSILQTWTYKPQKRQVVSHPSATLSPSIDFPVAPVIRSTLLRRFLAGTRRASPVAWHVLVTVLSLPPRRDQDAASVRFRHPMLPSPFSCGLGPRIHSLSRPLSRSLSLRPGDS